MTNGMRGFGVLMLVGAGVLGLNGACNIKSTTYEGDGGNGGSGNGTTTDATTTAATMMAGTGGYTNGVGVGGAPQTCNGDPNDACDTCFKTSCCTEIEACDAECEAKYVEYIDCIFPDGAASGYNSNYCKASVQPTGAAEALINCSVTNCYNDNACGAEVRDTWESFAGNFIENFCAGCHFDGYAEGDTPPEPFHLGNVDTRDYSIDETWDDTSIWMEQPFGNPQWFELLSYDNVVLDKDLIWCGLNEVLPDDCAQFTDPETGDPRFPVAKRFPPVGNDGVTECWWLGENVPCFQPTTFERARMSNWIFDGMPKE